MPIHKGDFDNTYYTTPGTGFLYMARTEATASGRTLVVRVGFTTNLMNTAIDATSLNLGSNSNGATSPLTEFDNGSIGYGAVLTAAV